MGDELGTEAAGLTTGGIGEVVGFVFSAAKQLIDIGFSAYYSRQKSREELKAEVSSVFAELQSKIEALPADTAALNTEMDGKLKAKFPNG